MEDAGADSISVANTFLGMAIDIESRRPYLANVTAGLSGPAIRPIVVRMVYQVAAAVRVPVVGVGGIASLEDALEYLLAGATAIQVGTATFVNPRTALDIVEQLPEWMRRHGIRDLSELVGAARVGHFRGAAPAPG